MTLTPEQKDIIDKYVKKPEWRVAGKRADFNAIGERFGVSPVVARVITNRGVTGEKAIAMYLDGDWDSMHDPTLMKDMVEAGEIIKEKLSDNRRIRIISDYDVDGVTSIIYCFSVFGEHGRRFTEAALMTATWWITTFHIECMMDTE